MYIIKVAKKTSAVVLQGASIKQTTAAAAEEELHMYEFNRSAGSRNDKEPKLVH